MAPVDPRRAQIRGGFATGRFGLPSGAMKRALSLFSTAALFAATALAAAGCSPKERKFESVCQIVSRHIVERDADGGTELVDLELEWDPCPGDQFQVIRGTKDFATCTEKYAPGTYVPVRVTQWWDARGFYRWDIHQLGDCPRTIEPDAEGSYEKSQECSDIVQYGRTTGFECMRRPEKKLIAVCPWMARK